MGLSLRKIGRKLEDLGGRAVAQINPLDQGRTFKNPTAIAPPQGRPAPSAFQQATHSGVSNFIGQNVVKPLGQFPIDASSQVYNRAVAPTFNLPKLNAGQTSFNPTVQNAANKLGATGSLHQTIGSGIQTGLTLGSGGLAKGIEAGATKLVPSTAPKVVGTLAPKVASNATIGSGFNAAATASQGAKPKEIAKSAVLGGALGGALPIAGAGARVIAKPVVKLATQKADNRIPLNAVGAVGKDVNKAPSPPPRVSLKTISTPENIPKILEQGSVKSTPVSTPVNSKINNTTPSSNIQIPLEATNKGTLRGEAQTAITDREAPLINLFKGIEKDTGQTGLVDQLYYDTGLQRRSNAIANAHLQSSENLKDALGGLKGKSKKDFDQYTAARAELSNAENGLPTTKPVEELQQTIQTLAPKHAERFNSLNKFYQEYADKMHAGGLIDDATHASFKSNPDYTRVQRVMDDLAGYRGQGGNSYSLGQTLAKQKRTGSTRRAIQPADTTAFKYAQDVQKEIQRNQTSTNLINVLESQGLAKQISAKEATRRNTIKRIVNGKTEIYEIPKDIKEVVDNVTPFQLGALGRIVSFPQRLLRAGATGLSAPFTAANYVKDQVSSGVFSKNVIATHRPDNIANGIYQAAKDFGIGTNDPMWQKFTQHLGDTTQYDFIRNAKNAKQLSREVRLKGGRAINRSIHPIRTLEDLNQVTEKATRFQNFKGIYNDTLKKGGTEADATRAATLAAWQNSVDFSRMGNVTQALNLLIPYFNAGVQGTRTLGRAFAQRPVATSAKTVAGVGIPLMGITLWNTSDKDRKAVYDNISDYEKQNNIVIVLPGAKQLKDGSYEGVIKVPLQPGLSNLVQPIRNGVESYAEGNPADVGKMAQEFLGAVSGPINTNSLAGAAGSLVPQAAKPLVQQYANKDLFTGKEIVPNYVEKATDSKGNPVPENKKAFDYTSGSSRVVGNVLGVSPIRIDKFIKDTSGKVGQYSQNTLDNALAKKGAIPKDQIGGVSVGSDFTRRFARASGKENFMKSEGAKYFDNVQKATSKLNGNELAGFNSLHPAKKNFLGDTISDMDSVYNSAARLDVYNRYPKVFDADKQLDAKARKEGNPGNPLFDLEKWQVKKVLEKENLPPGADDKELSKLREQDWYADYSTKKSNFFTAIKDKSAKDLADAKAKGDTEKVKTLQAGIDKFNSSDNPYPVTSPDLQKTMDYYSNLPKGNGARSAWIKGNPGQWNAMKDQFAKIDNWQNKQRGKRGLDTTEGTAGIAAGYGDSSKSYSSGGSSDASLNPYKYTVTAKTPKAKKSSISIRATAKPKIASKGAKPKVSLKSSKV